MSTPVHVDDILAMEVSALSPSTQSAFESLVERLRQDGLEGLPDQHVTRLPEDATASDDGPTWRVRMGNDHRAFVTRRDDGLAVINVASTKRLKKMRALTSNE
jgi:hypothetical protein